MCMVYMVKNNASQSKPPRSIRRGGEGSMGRADRHAEFCPLSTEKDVASTSVSEIQRSGIMEGSESQGGGEGGGEQLTLRLGGEKVFNDSLGAGSGEHGASFGLAKLTLWTGIHGIYGWGVLCELVRVNVFYYS